MKLVACPSCGVLISFDIVEVVHGSWVDDAKGGRSIHCTNCQALVNEKSNLVQFEKEKKR